MSEQPYKIPYYASLLALLFSPTPVSEDASQEDVKPTESTPAGQSVLEAFNKGFQEFLDALAWRELRLCVQFFAHLGLSRTVSASSLLALLQAFAAVLNEPGVSYSRAERAALCAGEGLIRVSQDLWIPSRALIHGICRQDRYSKATTLLLLLTLSILSPRSRGYSLWLSHWSLRSKTQTLRRTQLSWGPQRSASGYHLLKEHTRAHESSAAD